MFDDSRPDELRQKIEGRKRENYWINVIKNKDLDEMRKNVDYLVYEQNRNVNDDRGQKSALEIVTEFGWKTGLIWLLNIDTKTRNFSSLIDLSIGKGHADVALYLLMRFKYKGDKANFGEEVFIYGNLDLQMDVIRLTDLKETLNDIVYNLNYEALKVASEIKPLDFKQQLALTSTLRPAIVEASCKLDYLCEFPHSKDKDYIKDEKLIGLLLEHGALAYQWDPNINEAASICCVLFIRGMCRLLPKVIKANGGKLDVQAMIEQLKVCIDFNLRRGRDSRVPLLSYPDMVEAIEKGYKFYKYKSNNKFKNYHNSKEYISECEKFTNYVIFMIEND
jgi:hypothetical protein